MGPLGYFIFFDYFAIAYLTIVVVCLYCCWDNKINGQGQYSLFASTNPYYMWTTLYYFVLFCTTVEEGPVKLYLWYYYFSKGYYCVKLHLTGCIVYQFAKVVFPDVAADISGDV